MLADPADRYAWSVGHTKCRCSSPDLGEAQLGEPAIDVTELERLASDIEHRRHIVKLPLRIDGRGPLELRDDRDFGGRDPGRPSKELGPDSTPELNFRKCPIPSNDEVDLPARCGVDRVELTAMPECVLCGPEIDSDAGDSERSGMYLVGASCSKVRRCCRSNLRAVRAEDDDQRDETNADPRHH